MKKIKNNTVQPPEKEKKFQKIQRVIISVVVAVVVWVLVVNVVNPEITEPIKDVKVEFDGEAYLRNKGFVIVNKDEIPGLSVKVKGTRHNLLSGMKRINVVADVTEIDKKGKAVIPVKVSVPDKVSVEKQSFSTVEVMIEPRYDKKIPVIIEQRGDLSQQRRGRIISSVPELEEVSVSGSVSDVESIKNCIVTIDVSDIENDGKTLEEYRFVDKEGNAVSENSSVFCTLGAIPVNNTVYTRHTVDVEAEVNSMLRHQFKVEYDPRNINMPVMDIGASEGAEVPSKIIAVVPNIKYKEGRQTVKLEIKEEDGLYIPKHNIMLEVNIVPLKEKKSLIKLSFKNVPEGLQSQKSEITLEKKLLIPDDFEGEITGYVDCANFVSGTNEGKIRLDDLYIEFADNDDTISVNLVQK